MVFAYYSKLSSKQKSIYRKSDAIEAVPIRRVGKYRDSLVLLEQVLQDGDRKQTENIANGLLNALAQDVGAPALQVKVLSVRPVNEYEELHGIYHPIEKSRKASITVWMRTAKHKKVVAFRSFLRTLLHEFCHHLDYELFMFEETFHTEGFFKRESSLFRQLVKQD